MTQASPRIPTIGLMGAPGSGKSLVAEQLASLGCVVIDSDALSRRALAEADIQEQVIAMWGPDILGADGRIDRAALAKVVFADERQLNRLESLIHPYVHAKRAELRRAASAHPGVPALIEDSPLLLEAGIDRDCDVLVFVDAPLAVRLERVRRTRGWDAQELDRREKRQMPLDIKRQRADYMINNDAGKAHCLEQTRRVLSQITRRPPGD